MVDMTLCKAGLTGRAFGVLVTAAFVVPGLVLLTFSEPKPGPVKVSGDELRGAREGQERFRGRVMGAVRRGPERADAIRIPNLHVFVTGREVLRP